MKKADLLKLKKKILEILAMKRTQRICFALAAIQIFNCAILPVTRETEEKRKREEMEDSASLLNCIKAGYEFATIFYDEIEYNLLVDSVLLKERLTSAQLEEVLVNLVDNPIFNLKYNTRLEALKSLASENISYEEKMLIVMARRGNTFEEVDTVFAGGVAEAKGEGTCYEDAYAVGSTILNRSRYVPYYNTYGDDIYKIFTGPRQFSVYPSGLYKKYLGRIDLPGYQAMIDVFYTEVSLHDYLQFRGSWVNLDVDFETFVEGGNKHFSKMKEELIIKPADNVLESNGARELKI